LKKNNQSCLKQAVSIHFSLILDEMIMNINPSPNPNAQINNEEIPSRSNEFQTNVNEPEIVEDKPSVNVVKPVNGQHESIVDPSYYYRLTNAHSGPNQALDVRNDGRNYALKMAPIGDYSGQQWRFIPFGNNTYKLQNVFLKGGYSLDIVNDGVNIKTHMAKTGSYTGQRWHLRHLIDGAFRMYNDFSGNKKFLDVYSDSQIPFMGIDKKGNSPEQHWTFTKIKRI
jgi:hypothetical protein